MKPSIGRIVIVRGISSNGLNEHPAIINHVWSEKDTAEEPVCINCTVLPDCGPVQSRTSILLYENRQAADQANAGSAPHAFWADRI